MIKVFRRFRRSINKKDSDGTIENQLQSSAELYRKCDPDTEARWHRLKNAIESEQRIFEDSGKLRKNIFSKPAFSFAIGAIVVILSGTILLRYFSTRTYETTRGQRSDLKLRDSTEVVLNYMSELKVDRWILNDTRYVSLKGEALFHVRKNGAPFVITTEIGTIQVLGTKFNVRARGNSMEVAVLEGTVKVSTIRDGKDSSVCLTKGQILTCGKNGFPGRPESNPFNDYPGWTQGRLMFYRTSFRTACEELEMQFDLRIEIENSCAQNASITGIVNSMNAESALATITQLTGSRYRYEKGRYIIY